MRNTALALAAIVFIALVFGGYAIANGQGLPTTEQVSSPEASTLEATQSQQTTLGLVAIVVIASVGGMGFLMAVIVWLLNREVTKAHQEDNHPFSFSLDPEGNSVGAIIQENPFMIAITLGIIFVLIFIALVLFSGALA